MAYRHSRTASSTSDIHLTDTVSYLQRCLFGNLFRNQRQVSRFFLSLGVVMLVLYLAGPWDSTSKHKVSRIKNKSPTITATAHTDKNEESETEYRARYFEEIGWKMDKKLVDLSSLNSLRNKIVVEDEKEEKKSSAALEEIARKVKQVAEKVAKCKDVAGLAVTLVKGDSSLVVPLGLADVTSGQAVTSDTRFLLNSISKTFLGQLLAVLINEAPKNISLDSTVASILGPDFQLATEELTKEVTLRDLMSHRTGLSSGNLAVRATYPAGWTRADLVKQLRYLPPSVPFRKSFLYSNMCGMLAAHVAEKLGGATWENLIVEKLLEPIGMMKSGALKSHTELMGQGFAKPYVPVEGKITECDTRIFAQGPLSAVALLTTTPSDMAKWICFNLRQGQLENGKQLIPRDICSAMWTQQAELSPMFLQAVDKSSSRWPVRDISLGYGLFWFINKYRGFKNYWHGGGLYTHYGLTWIFPEKDVGLYVTINGYSGDSKPFSIVESLAYYTADLLLGYQPWLDENSICEYPDQWVSDVKSFSSNRSSDDADKLSKTKDNQFPDAHNKKFPNSINNNFPNLLNKLPASQKNPVPENGYPIKTNGTSRISSLLSDSFQLSDLARMKLEAVVESYEKLTTPRAVRNFERSDTAPLLNRSVRSLTRKIREARSSNAVEQFEILKHQNASKHLKTMQVMRENNLENVESNVPSELLDIQQSSSQVPKAKLPFQAYQGFYSNPLIGNVTIFLVSFSSSTSSQLQCKMNLLTGLLHLREGHKFDLELTGSLQFLSKPSQNLPAKPVYKVEFIEDGERGVVALDFHSNWSMEVPLRFYKVR